MYRNASRAFWGLNLNCNISLSKYNIDRRQKKSIPGSIVFEEFPFTRTSNKEKAVVLEDDSSYSGMVRVEILTGPQAGYQGWVMYPFVELAE